MNDYAFILERIKECNKIKSLLEWLAIDKQCKFIHLDTDAYEYYCTNEKAKPNKKENQKHGYDFEPERDCIKCPLYQTKGDIQPCKKCGSLEEVNMGTALYCEKCGVLK
jgi:hypothetical protein